MSADDERGKAFDKSPASCFQISVDQRKFAEKVFCYLCVALTISSTLRKSSSVSTPTVLNGVSAT